MPFLVDFIKEKNKKQQQQMFDFPYGLYLEFLKL